MSSGILGVGAIGIITEKDILEKVVAKGRDPRKVTMEDIMSTPLLVAPSNTTMREAAEKMVEHRVRRLIITDEDGKLVGLVTMTDILRWIAQGQGNSNYSLRYLSKSE